MNACAYGTGKDLVLGLGKYLGQKPDFTLKPCSQKPDFLKKSGF